MRGYLLASLLLLTVAATLTAQPNNTTDQTTSEAHFKSGSTSPSSWIDVKNIQQYAWDASEFDGSLYLLVQLDAFPASESEFLALESQGLKILHYIPYNTYLAKVGPGVDLSALGVIRVAPYLPDYKFAPELASRQAPDYAYDGERIWIQARSFDGVSQAQLQTALQTRGFKPKGIKGDRVQLLVNYSEMEDIAADPAVLYIEPIDAPAEHEGLVGGTLQAVNMVTSAPGVGYDGSGVAVEVGDDGQVIHVDLLGRIIHHTNSNIGDHGDMVVGILAGAGNKDPLALGVASGATVHVYKIDGYPQVTDAIQHHQTNGMVISSTSYGEGCGAYYNTNAVNLDQQMYQHDKVLHVFSAGNSASSSCNTVYGGVTDQFNKHFGNITGGRKAAKHAIAVANVYYNDNLHGSSSRGPTLDGRIKPDISAQGQGNLTTDSDDEYRLGGGTSAAAPSLAGVAAIVFQAFRSINGGANPAASLVKAILLNSAEDIFLPGPDYYTGWGRVHAKRAVETVEQRNHFAGQVSHNGLAEYQINVPADVEQVRFMVYWLDPAGAPMASQALVNDLDMSVRLPNGQHRLPWVLPTSPNLDSLTAPAYAGYDRVNNMEQVVIDNPQSGVFTIKIKGYSVPQGPQSFHLVYTFIDEPLEITYPIGGESMVPGETQVIRWDAIDNVGNFQLQYSTDNKATWQTISNSIASSTRYFNWVVPNSVSGQVFFRVRRGTTSSTSPAACSIMGQPQFVFNTISDQQATINWSEVPGANQYDIYKIGNEYMEIIGSTSTTDFTINVTPQHDDYYSVRARFNNSIFGRRTYARKYQHNPCQTNVTLNITFDIYPGETRWEIKDQTGQVVAAGGPYNGYGNFSAISIDKCLPYGCYNLVMYDALGDGICCSNGQGHFELYAENGTLLAQGGSFNSQSTQPFCIDPSMDDDNNGNDDPQPDPLVIQSLQLQHNSCATDNEGWIFLEATGGTGNYSYVWNTGQSGNFINQLAGGIYSVTITDGDQQITSSYMIVSPSPITAAVSTSSTSCNASSGSASVTTTGGVPPYNYTWSNGASGNTITDLNGGNHSVTITDQNNCSIVKYFNIQASGGIDLDFYTADVTCASDENGVAIVIASGGQGPYTYQWDNGVSKYFIVNQSKGNYTVTVTDFNGCTKVGSVEIGGPDAIEVVFSIVNPSCNGTSSGQVTAQISGGNPPYQSTWNTGSNDLQLTNLTSGSYWINVTDSWGCSTTATVVLDMGSDLDISGTVEDEENNANGSIDIEVTNGLPPYTYAWSNGATSQDLTNLQAGAYTVTVTDNGGCSQIEIFVVDQVASDPGYCNAQGSSTSYEWIDAVEMGAYEWQSGNNNGYVYHENTPWEFAQGETIDIILTPGYTNTAYKEYWRVWIDLNQDGDFADDEEIVFSYDNTAGEIQGNLTIPNIATLGLTRMRVAMKYGSLPPYCNNYGYGEVEDFDVEIIAPNSNIVMAPSDIITNTIGTRFEPSPVDLMSPDRAAEEQLPEYTNERPLSWNIDPSVTIFPNPASEEVSIQIEDYVGQSAEFRIYNGLGQLVLQQRIDALDIPSYQIDLSDLNPGQFWVDILVGEDRITEPLIIARGN